ncbi:ADP-ribosylglycohydrolase family protein [Thermomonospora catenispora]|uniref:ADP-ribosylglycohydrolase family protein n=1 Tax=Thermomonospora catenispora TaxID=2493090 RepID=UPI00111D5BB5|nr:ADP-ribosylglycohydrolase family protein [Thermomonospora catenispora]TNY37148.1 ADP-ribosylglycohydrolase family protein [Thermomonospora catenispora]
MPPIAHAAGGCLFGLAYGDALGAPTEFLSMEQIRRRYGPLGPADLPGPPDAPALVTDDTQMTIAVAEGLLDALERPPLTPERVLPHWRRRFIDWLHDPRNDRAPGNTCLRACRDLDRGVPWVRATVHDSKGCGAVMRVAPVGLVRGLTDEQRAGAAQLQAALTHGHPTGLAAGELTAFAVWWLREGMDPAELPAALRERCHRQRTVYRSRWLEDLWRRPSGDGASRQGAADSPEAFIARGWDECLAALDRLESALARADRDADPCLITGAGWVAEEAMATGLLCFLLFPDDPVSAIRRGAASSGDSDSIACLAGAFAGAHLGLEAWPAAWAERIEYADELARLARAWD